MHAQGLEGILMIGTIDYHSCHMCRDSYWKLCLYAFIITSCN